MECLDFYHTAGPVDLTVYRKNRPADYEIEDRIGQGGFGIVFRVHSKANPSQIYVVKEVYLPAVDQEHVRQLAIKEAEIMKSLKNVYIVNVFDHSIDGNIFRMSMEYCDSGTLKDAIRNREGKPFPEVQIRSWMAQLVLVLKHLHGKRILHRDIKSENVFLTSGGSVIKLGDFGVSKVLSPGVFVAHTQIGTVTNMAPEMFPDGEDDEPCYTYKSEVWALGIVIYELIALKLPYTGKNEKMILRKIQNERPVKPLPTSFSVELRELVEKRLLNKDPEQRPSMLEIMGETFVREAITTLAHRPSFRQVSPAQNAATALHSEANTFIQENADSLSENVIGDLLLAAENGDTRIIKEILRAVGKSQQLVANSATWENAPNNNDNDTALHRAARRDQIEAFRMLWPIMSSLAGWKNSNKLACIHVAALNNSCRVVQFCLDNQRSLLELKGGQFGRTPLHAATYSGHAGLVKILVENYNANMHAKSSRSSQEKMPIHVAAERGHLVIVKYLLTRNRNLIDAKDGEGNLPIHSAALAGKIEIVGFLISTFGASVELRNSYGQTPLHCAVQEGQFDLVKVLITKYKADIYAKTNSSGDYEMMPIHLAVENGRLEITEYFLKMNPDLIYALDKQGNAPVHTATLAGQVDLDEYLISRFGVNLLELRQESHGRTPLHLASEGGNLNLVKILVGKYNANVYARSSVNDLQNMPIHRAAFCGKLQIVEYFLDTNPDLIHVKDSQGNRPIHKAVLGGQVAIVELLITRGASVELRQDSRGRTPLHQAAERGHLELAKVLVTKYNANVYAKSKGIDYEKMPIHMAVLQGQLEVVKFFIEKYPDLINAKDSAGRTPLQLAGNLKEAHRVVAWLKSKNAE